MLWLDLDSTQYEYEIRGLAMAFYPGGEIANYEEGQMATLLEGDLFLRFRKQETIVITVRVMGSDVELKEELIDPVDEKTAVKCALYRIFSHFSGRELVWGTLTGVRPTKVAYKLLCEGASMEDATKTMMTEHYLSEEKAKLGVEIAALEHKLLQEMDYQKGYSVYIGIPFCPTKCLYCSFTSYPLVSYRKMVDTYLDALEKEIVAMAGDMRDTGLKVDTVYIGGGTPTTLDPEQLDRLLTILEREFDLSHCREFTVEGGRPDSITREKLLAIKAHNVTRISINPQTMKDATLKLIGRQHNVAQVREAYTLARELGFDNINMDLILGLPEETAEDVANTLREIKEMAPDNLTVHTLALKRASRLNTEAEYAAYRYHSGETTKMMEYCAATAKELGLVPYYLYRQKNMSDNLENVGYALQGKEGLYNILMMEEMQSIIACGAGTVTKRVFADGHIERTETVKDVKLYIEKIDEMIERKRRLFAL